MKLFILQIVLKLLSFLPLSCLRAIGSYVGVIAIKLSKRSSKRLRANLLITGMCTEEQVGQFATDTAKELGKTLVESAAIAWQKSTLDCAKLVKHGDNFEKVKAAVAAGPTIFLTPHIGNFEISLQAVAAQMPDKYFNILYKPEKDHVLNTIMKNGRSAPNINPVPTTRIGVAKLLRALKQGEAVGILPDNVASGGDGVWVNFFGKKVFATTLAAKMLLFEGATTFLVFSKRVEEGFTVEYMPYAPRSRDISVIVQEIYTIIEGMVLKAPTQYYWSYDRFRVPSHAPAINNTEYI
jgi:KDO2-lipid IV(A) lauroyltransferase